MKSALGRFSARKVQAEVEKKKKRDAKEARSKLTQLCNAINGSNDGALVPEFEPNEDPFELFGIGVYSYFQMLSFFVKVLLVIAFVHIPLYMLIREKQVASGPFGNITIGSLGQASSECVDVKADIGEILLECSDGKISEFTAYGLFKTSSKLDEVGICNSIGVLETGMSEVCKAQSQPQSYLFENLLVPCLGQSRCAINHPKQTLAKSGDGC